MLARLRGREEWKFFGGLRRADGPLALAWWTVLLIRGLLPALFVSSLGRGLLALGWLSMFCFGIFPPLLLLLVIGEFGLGGNMHKRQH